MVQLSTIASTFAWFLALASADYIKFDAKKLKGSWAQNADTDKAPLYAYSKKSTIPSNSTSVNETVIGVFNDKIYYAVDLSIGSDEQNVTVLVDTVSSDLWINSIDNSVCIEGANIPSNLTFEYAYSYSQYPSSITSSSSSSSSSTESATPVVTTYYSTTYNSESDVYVVNQYVSTEITTTTVTTTNIGTTRSYDVQFYPSVSASSSTNWFSQYPHPTYTIDILEVLEYEPQNCSSWGLFNSSSSESFSTDNETFSAISSDDTEIKGIWGTDDILYGDYLVPNVSFGLVSDSELDSFGILGLGLPSFESTWLQNGTLYEDNFISQLKAAELINKSVYSIYDNYMNNGSSLLFGGVDLEAFHGNLSIVPLIDVPLYYNDSRNASAIAITLSSIYFDDELEGKNESTLLASGLAAAIIDTTLATASVPYYIYDSIITASGFEYSTTLEAFVANSSKIENQTIVFDFQGVEIDVSIFDLTFPLIDISSDNDDDEISDLVVFGLDATPNNTFILGDAILQYMYVAINLDDLEVAIAPKNFEPETEEIVAITETFPNATTVLSYNYTYGYHDVTELKLATVADPNKVSSTSFSISYIPSITAYSTTAFSYSRSSSSLA